MTELGFACLFSESVLLGASSTAADLSVDDVECAAVASVASKYAFLRGEGAESALGHSDARVSRRAGDGALRSWCRDDGGRQGKDRDEEGRAHVDVICLVDYRSREYGKYGM